MSSDVWSAVTARLLQATSMTKEEADRFARDWLSRNYYAGQYYLTMSFQDFCQKYGGATADWYKEFGIDSPQPPPKK